MPEAPEPVRALLSEALTARATLLLALTGAALCVLKLVREDALWLDEAAIALNLQQKGLWELLTRPLAWDQVAPPGFLLVSKLLVSALGSAEWVLHLPATACAIGLLFAFRDVAHRLFPGPARLLAVLAVALAPAVYFLSAQAKQYAGDGLAVVLVLRAALLLEEDRTPSRRRLWGLAALGVALALSSMPGVLALTASGAVLLGLALVRRDGTALRARAPVVAAWALGCGAMALWSLSTVSPATRAYMQRFWSEGMPGFPPPTSTALQWLGFTHFKVTEALIAFPLPAVQLAVLALGLLLLLRRRPAAALLLLGPYVLAYALALARVYPLSERTMAFLVFPMLLVHTAGAAWLVERAWAWRRGAGFLVAALALAGPVTAVASRQATQSREPTRKVFEQLAKEWKPGDAVYLTHWAGLTYDYYRERLGLPREGVTYGGCHHPEWRESLVELDAFRGQKRVWFVVTNGTPYFESATAYLDAIGRRAGHWPFVNQGYQFPASLHLYDLSDPRALASADAATFPLQLGRRKHGAWYCDGPLTPLQP
jgi:hypothetical protein